MNKIKNTKTMLLVLILCLSTAVCGCGSKADSKSDGGAQSESAAAQTQETSAAPVPVDDSEGPTEPQGDKNDESEPDNNEPKDNVVQTDLKPSEGLEFESNGDGTCTITGIGVCTDTDLVIPEKSPDGETVTLIDEYAFMSIESVNSVTLINYCYEVDKKAFEYGEFKEVNIIGGSPVINKNAFANCEDLTKITFSDCALSLDEYAFFCSGKDAEVSFTNCTGLIDKKAFEYSEMASLSISDCDLELKENAFANCEKLTSVSFANSTIAAGEYAFFCCGDSAVVSITDCSITLDDKGFEYSSLSSIEITGSKLEAGENAFSSCEDLTVLNIDCDYVSLGEYAFYSCEDLTDVSICDNPDTDNEIQIDDKAFEYCDSLKKVVIGSGTVTVGEYVFSGGEESMEISVAGKSYTAEGLKKGLK